jgi:predicted small secreted protein
MKKSTLKQIIVFAVFVAFAASVSSCNKGYGCPTNFKAVKTAVNILK